MDTILHYFETRSINSLVNASPKKPEKKKTGWRALGKQEFYMNNIDFALGTHTGLVRKLNEDSHIALPKLGLWVIADGMGGHKAGEVASGIAIREMARAIEQGRSLALPITHKSLHTTSIILQQ
jgi:hypothetical protein